MQTEQQVISPNHRHLNPPSICQECTQNPWKYRCPCCSILTCSLPCVKSHKQRTNCTGKKDPFEKTISRSCFNDDFIISGTYTTLLYFLFPNDPLYSNIHHFLCNVKITIFLRIPRGSQMQLVEPGLTIQAITLQGFPKTYIIFVRQLALGD